MVRQTWLVTGMLAAMLVVAAHAEEFARVGTFGPTWIRFPVDARGEAMGLATTVNPRGATAFWWNAAPLPDGDRFDVSYTVWEHVFSDLGWRPAAVRLSRDNLTVGLLWGRLHVGPTEVRTAYEPDGNGEFVEFTDHLVQLSAAYDLAPWLTRGRPDWIWTLGANLKHVREELVETNASVWDLDLASSVAWVVADSPDLRLRWHATAMVHNLSRGTLEYSELITTRLPRYYHFGLGFDAAFGELEGGRRLLEVAVSHAWHRDLDDNLVEYDSEHVGCEVTAAGLVSVRAGHRTRGVFDADGWSWGAGVQYRTDRWWGLRAGLDYASFEISESFAQATQDHWTFSVGVDLPR